MGSLQLVYVLVLEVSLNPISSHTGSLIVLVLVLEVRLYPNFSRIEFLKSASRRC